MPEQREINLASKEGLDALVAGQDIKAYTAPVQTADDLLARGLIDETGTATKRGVLFTQLMETGIFDESGKLTEKGFLYSIPENELGKPENLRAFKAQWDDEIIRPETTFKETVGATGKFLGDAAKGLATRFSQEAQSLYYNSKTWSGFFGLEDNRPERLKQEMVATGLGLAEGATENAAQWAGMADVGSAWLGKKLYDIMPGETEDTAEEALYAARQRQWQLNRDIEALEAGEAAELVLGIDEAKAQAEQASAALGAEEFGEQYIQASAASQIVADPTNLIPAAAAAKAAQAGSLSTRAMLKAQQTIGKVAMMDAEIAALQVAKETGEAVLKKEALSVELAKRMSQEIAERGAENPALIERSAKASNIAARISNDAAKMREGMPTLTRTINDLTAKRQALATRIPEQAAQKVIQTIETGRKLKALPARTVGATLERVGSGLTKTDTAITSFLKERGLDQLYAGAVGASGMLGLAGNPLLGAVGVGAGVLKTGKLLESYGKMFRYVGKEMAQARGQIPFWQRVAAHTQPGTANRALAHTFGIFELGGATSDVLRRTTSGVAAAVPVDLAFEWLADGADMRKQTVYQAVSESMLLGGSFAAGGGIFMGTKNRMKQLAAGDEVNFRQGITDENQKALYEAIPAQTRRAIATYSIANPTLNFRFTNKGGSHYDPRTNTASINVNSTKFIKALVAHEVLHHTIIKNQMEGMIAALFLGDVEGKTSGGLLRSKDGQLDPNFAEFVEAYNLRMDNAGLERPKLNDLAVEYFIEQHADQYSQAAESGELGATSARGQARRGMSAILETLLPKAPVLRDLHFKMGGAVDANGVNVTGNGLLGEHLRKLPITQKMFRDMNRRSAGRPPGQFEPLGTASDDGGASLLVDPSSAIDIGLLGPLIQHDDKGNPILKDGKPVFIDKATDLARSTAGATVMERMRKDKESGRKYAPGEMHLDDDGNVQGNYLPDDVLREVISKHKFNREQAQIMRSVNAAIKTGDGNRMIVVNFPATRKLRSGKTVYAPQAAAVRDIVPVSLTITKDGNLLVGLMSVTKLHENIAKRAQSKRGKRLYGGNIDLILQDAVEMMKYHKKGVDSIVHFDEKYGAVEGKERKLFINSVFGLLNKTEQAALNPVILEDGVTQRDNVYRTYRVDRISKAAPLSPDESPAMPFNYEATKQVKMPESKMMPEQMDAAYLQAVESGDMETAQRMVDEAAKAAGYNQRAYHGTWRSGFTVFKELTHFSPEKTYADRYQSTSASSMGISGVKEAANQSTYEVFLKMQKPFDTRQPKSRKLFNQEFLGKWGNGTPIQDRGLPDWTDSVDLAEWLNEEHHGEFDSFILDEGAEPTEDGTISVRPESFVPLDPRNIKSADPVTYDAQGNVIPLSQRFNPQSDDIRYMPEASTISSANKEVKIHEDTGLPLNQDGTVTVYHGTTKEGKDSIEKTGVLKSAGEPDIYFTTERSSAATGYGDGTVVAVRINPDKLILDDEFPDGRKDFRVHVGSKKQLPVKLDANTSLIAENDRPVNRYMPETIDIPANASGKAVKTKLKHSKTPARFDAENATVLSPGIRMLPEPVYHGTPHKVDKFSTEKIGTGEGAQSYGWGLYFAEARKVAERYQRVLAKTEFSIGDSVAQEAWYWVDSSGGDRERAVASIEENLANPPASMRGRPELALRRKAMEYLRDGKPLPEVKKSSNLYTVRIKPEVDEFLDWDKPLSEQSEGIKNAIIKAAPSVKPYDIPIDNNPTGAGIYGMISAPSEVGAKKTSEFLKSLGIRGIRYLDGNSRSDGEGSYNYVIFDENDIEIIAENDKPVTE